MTKAMCRGRERGLWKGERKKLVDLIVFFKDSKQERGGRMGVCSLCGWICENDFRISSLYHAYK